jgi:hypothetical protein
VKCQFPVQGILQKHQQFENETEPHSLLNTSVGMDLLKKEAVVK